MSPSKLIVPVLLSSILVLGCKPKNPNLYGVVRPETPPIAQNTKYEGPTSIPAVKPTQQPIPQGTKVIVPPPPPPPPEPARYTQVDSEIFKPKVDILFMMDTSKSMLDHQNNLKANINVFSKNFLAKKEFVDFHIGVVSPWDAINFKAVDKFCKQGELRPLGGNKGKNTGDCRPTRANPNELPYITNNTESDEKKLNKLLASTLSIGVEDLKLDNIENSGPEHEQLFSPIIAALKPENAKLNKNFRREDAHLAVIFLTDTDDFNFLTIAADAVSMKTKTTRDKLVAFAQNTDPFVLDKLEISVDEIGDYLLSLKKENVSVSVYGALARYNQLNDNDLGKEYDLADFYIQGKNRGPKKMVALLEKMEGTGFDLNEDNFGAELSKIGNDIVKKSLRRVIVLDHTPEINPERPIIVKYGKNQIIPKDDNTGWRYTVDEDKVHRITISENINIRPEAGAKFSVEYTPVIKQN